MSVAIVTDSTSTLPAEIAAQFTNISVAPQIVIWGEEVLRDRIDITCSTFYDRLSKSPTSPTTSQATIASFQEIFQDLHSKGHEILCVLISSKLSGTINSAVQAKELVPGAKVEIVDSLSASMGLGFQVVEAAKAAAAGRSLAECKAVAEKAVKHTGVVLAPETLEYLIRGGRLTGGKKLLATALNIKPVLALDEGKLEPVDRVRTRSKAKTRLVELMAEHVGDQRPVRVAAIHANSRADAEEMLNEAVKRFSPVEALMAEVSPAIGTHTGPGTIGMTWMAGIE
jgi:DegV family protein with EDD domain